MRCSKTNKELLSVKKNISFRQTQNYTFSKELELINQYKLCLQESERGNRRNSSLPRLFSLTLDQKRSTLTYFGWNTCWLFCVTCSLLFCLQWMYLMDGKSEPAAASSTQFTSYNQLKWTQLELWTESLELSVLFNWKGSHTFKYCLEVSTFTFILKA